DIRVDEHRRCRDRVRLAGTAQLDAVLGLDAQDLAYGHEPTLLRALASATGDQRYCPVATRSIARPPSPSAASLLTSVRMNTMRSPFLPEIFAQSSGFVVLGRSSCSLYSWRIDTIRSSVRMPLGPPAMSRLIATFFARRTMFSIIAPDEKSLKYMISLSPFWYVTSRNWLSSSSLYISRTVSSIIDCTALAGSPPPRLFTSPGSRGRSEVR